MKRTLCLAFSILTAFYASPALAAKTGAGFEKDVIYQIITDRFFNGRSDNDDPAQSKGMFDPDKKNWRAYWGGDLAGVTEKLPYIKRLGATAVWISPLVDNINKPSLDAKGKMMAPYHGYWPRDFKRLDEHFSDPQQSWKDFDALVSAAHQLGMKVIVDFPANHTSEYNHAEYGALYDDGHFKCESNYDKFKFFHHLPQVTDWNDRYQLQYGTVFYLADLDQENQFIDRYLKISAEQFLKHGADATRLDAAKHVTWGWEQSLADYLHSRSNHLVFAEWWIQGTSDPLYRDGVKFSNKGGIPLLDFPFACAVRYALGTRDNVAFNIVSETVEQEAKDFENDNQLLTFIDNHDMQRWLSLSADPVTMRLALGLLLTSRGVPIIYYGTEQSLHNDTNNGDDPYDRPWMSSFDETGTTFKLIQRLIEVRGSSQAFAFGKQRTLQVGRDHYIFSREFGGDTVVVAINKSHDTAYSAPPVSTALHAGEYKDALKGWLNGSGAVADADGKICGLALPPQSVSIWIDSSHADDRPKIGSISPAVAGGGAPVVVTGTGFGAERGKVLVAGQPMNASSWSNNEIAFAAPYLNPGRSLVEVVTADGARSDGGNITVLDGPTIPIRFIVKKAPLQPGQQLFISGDCVSLGNDAVSWNDAAGPMLFSEDRDYILCVPMPANKKVRMKLVILDKDGKLVREDTAFQSYHVPSSGSWRQELVWHD